MRLEFPEPKNESGLYQGLRRRTAAYVYYERIEPATESGFPDVHFVLRPNACRVGTQAEGTIELKFDRKAKLNLKPLMRGSQISALLDYFEAGGQRRFALCYHNGILYWWNTADLVKEVLGNPGSWTAKRLWNEADEQPWSLVEWMKTHGMESTE